MSNTSPVLLDTGSVAAFEPGAELTFDVGFFAIARVAALETLAVIDDLELSAGGNSLCKSVCGAGSLELAMPCFFEGPAADSPANTEWGRLAVRDLGLMCSMS